jgi:hypothetical protein
MGLDMYLNKLPKIKPFTLWETLVFAEEVFHDFEKFRKTELYDAYKPYIKKDEIGFHSMSEEIGYWRKANAIHKWFIENTNEVDDGNYEVTKADLEKLKEACEKVINGSKLDEGLISIGQRFVNGEFVDILEEGKIIANPELAQSILPAQDGFFFGSLDYDEFYIDKLQQTVDIIKEALEKTDFETEYLYYWASW